MRRNLRQLALAFIMVVLLGTVGIKTSAVEYTVVPTSGILYTGSGAELFSEPDAAKVISILPADAPVQVTGATNNGFFQVLINGNISYVYGKALSTQKGTYAETLTYINAKAAIVVDDAGNIIYEMNSQTQLAPASTTKMMTALLTMEAIAKGQISLDTQVVVSSTALKGLPSDASHVTPRLKAGEVLNVLSLLEAVMIKSDCHACNVLAELIAGNVDTFVTLMNMKAKELGCTGTNFVNTSGYPAKNHYTNAYSLSLIAREAMKYEDFRTIVSLKEVTIPATNLSKARTFENTNLLMTDSQYYNPYVVGIKTGYTKAAGLCLVTCAVKNNKKIYTVVLGANSGKDCMGNTYRGQFTETNKLIAMAYATAVAK